MKRLVAALLLLFLAVLPVSAANVFQSTVVIGMATRAGNTYTFQGVTVPTGVRGLQLIMDLSEATGDLPALNAALEGSLDGGTTWISAGSFTRSAGPKGIDPRTGVTQTIAGASFGGGDFWSDTTNPDRRLRGSATIGGTMRFALTVQPL